MVVGVIYIRFLKVVVFISIINEDGTVVYKLTGLCKSYENQNGTEYTYVANDVEYTYTIGSCDDGNEHNDFETDVFVTVKKEPRKVDDKKTVNNRDETVMIPSSSTTQKVDSRIYNTNNTKELKEVYRDKKFITDVVTRKTGQNFSPP